MAMPPTEMAARRGSKATPARPAAASKRPQLASSPNSAVLTSMDVATVLAAVLASARVRQAAHLDLGDVIGAFAVGHHRARQHVAHLGRARP